VSAVAVMVAMPEPLQVKVRSNPPEAPASMTEELLLCQVTPS
jgi:hypothetical protein